MRKWIQSLHSVQWKLVLIYLLLIIIAMQLIGVYFIRELEDFYVNVLKKDLKRQVILLHDPVRTILEDTRLRDEEKKKRVDRILDQLVFLKVLDHTPPSVLVQIIDPSGFVLNSTEKNEHNLPVKRRVLLNPTTKPYFQLLKDPHLQQTYQVFVKPILSKNDKRIGFIYIESSLKNTYQTVRYISKILIKITLLALVITITLVIILARTITHPIKEIRQQASAMAKGQFNLKVDVRSQDEIGQLATEFNHLAAQLRRALAQKEEEKEKLESVLANMSDGVIATDPYGKVIIKNQRAEKILSRPIHLYQSIQDILPLTELSRFPLLEERQSFFELDTQDQEEQTIIKATLTPITLKGEVMGLITLLEDVTEQEKLHRQRKEFVANVSHELRTPLTTIKSYLEALEDGAIHEAELAPRFLRVARQEADRMTRLIQELLHLSRLEAKQSRFNKKALYIEELLEGVVGRFAFQCKQSNVEITLHMGASLPRVYIDRDKIEQVLDNLISNAIKYTPPKGAIAVISSRKADGMVEIAVADTGIGIPKKDLGRIFERFYRVDKARSRSLGGTGLGLSISQEIILAHEGNIEIHSVYQRGTVVSFTLPPFEGEII